MVEKTIKLDQVKCISMSPLSTAIAFNVAAQGVRKGSNWSLVGWLKHGPKGSPQ